MTHTYNRLAAIKELGAIEHRLTDDVTDPYVTLHCVRRNLDNLINTLPRKFWGILHCCRTALDAGDTLELIAGLALIRSMIPVTYGMLPAGATLRSSHMAWQGECIKRKSGIEIKGRIYPHPRGDLPVVEVTT